MPEFNIAAAVAADSVAEACLRFDIGETLACLLMLDLVVDPAAFLELFFSVLNFKEVGDLDLGLEEEDIAGVESEGESGV